MPFQTVRVPKPDITLTIEEGGSLPENTTYYFVFVFTAVVNGGFLSSTGWYYNRMVSPLSEQLSITTSATHRKIRVTVNNDRTTLNYHVGVFARWDTIPVMDGDGKIIVMYSPKWFPTSLVYASLWNAGFSPSIPNNYLIENTSPLATNALRDLINHPPISMTGPPHVHPPYTIDDFARLDYTEVSGIYITGTESLASLKAYVLNDPVLSKQFIFTRDGFTTCVMIAGASNSSFTFQNQTIHLVGNSLSDVPSFNFNRCSITIDRYAMYAYISGNYMACQIQAFGGITLDLRTATFLDVSFQSGVPVVQYSGTSGLRFFITNFRVNCASIAIPVVHSDMVFERSIIDTNIKLLTYQRFYFKNHGQVDYDILISGFKFVDTPIDFEMLDVTTDRPSRLTLLRFAVPSGTVEWRNSLRFRHTYSTAYSITDETGTSIPNATVKLIDALGFEYTNPTKVLSYETKRNDNVGGILNTDQLQRNPFTLLVSAPGYQTYKEVLSIYQPQTKTISLKPLPEPIPFSLRRLVSRLFASGKPITGSQEQVDNQLGTTDVTGSLVLPQERRLTYLPESNAVKVEVETPEGWEELHTIAPDDELVEAYASVIPDPPPVPVYLATHGALQASLQPTILNAEPESAFTAEIQQSFNANIIHHDQ